MSDAPRLSEAARDRLRLAGEACRDGRLDEAAGLSAELRDMAGEHPAVIGLAGVISHLRGDLRSALAQLERAVALAPDDSAQRQNLALALLDAGRPDQAGQQLATVLESEPDNAQALELRAEARGAAGQPEQALAAWRELLRVHPDHPTAESRIVDLVGRMSAGGGVNPVVARELSRLLDSPRVEPNLLAVSLAYTIAARHGIGPDSLEPPLDALARDELLLRSLRTLYFTEPVFERFLTRLRRRLLEECRALGRVPAGWQPLIGALAVHNLRNEYIHAVSVEEEEAVEVLAARLREGIAAGPDPSALTGPLLLAGLYRSPASLPGAEELASFADEDWPEAARALVTMAFIEPAREAAQAEGIEALAEIREGTSATVRAMYEENPYPRWDRLGPVVPGTVDERLRRMIPGLGPMPEMAGKRVDVLIAGAGTGRHALRAAAEYTNAHVLAIDISRRSLAYGARKAEELGIANVEFLQADLFDLPKLERRFHVVETIGTLETLDDPPAGWKLLADLLEPGGFLYVGSYSETARRPVVRAREQIRELGLDGSPADMRAYRQRILRGELGADGRMLARCGDFYTLSGCRDFLFHVREQRFRISELARLMEGNDLAFLGFHPLKPDLRAAYLERYPDDPAARNLDNWSAFEESEPDTFCRLMNLSMLYYWLRKRGQ